MTELITEPGVYSLSDEDYFADPIEGGSLSSSGARAILPPGCPALFRHQQQHGRPDTAAFDFGHAAHRLVLGVGPDIVGVDADNWRTKAAQEQDKEIRAKGCVPLLLKDLARVEEMAEALRAHPLASLLFATGTGTPEAVLVWRDTRSGVMLRAKLDWLPDAVDGRMIVPDYKTAVSADPQHFARNAASYGYPQQAAFYIDGAKTLGLADDPAFLFVVQQKTAPYLVTVVELDSTALRIGRNRNREAIDLYAHCRSTDTWPGYADDDIVQVSLPRWYETENLEHIA